MRRLFCVLLAAVFALSLVACGNGGQAADEKERASLLSGAWYIEGEQEPAFILYGDGTCEIANEYGTGTWSVVNENQLQLTSYYGETEVITIHELTADKLVLGSGKDTQVFWNEEPSSAGEQNKQPSEGAESQEPVEEAVVQLTQGSVFSDGVAWVKYVEETGAKKIGIMNTEGRITPVTADEVTGFGSDFSNGYAYVNYADRSDPSETRSQFVIVDPTGSVVGRSPQDGSYEILTGGDGVFLVRQAVRGMTVSEIRIGLIDQAGNWICEPAVQHVLSLSSAAQDSYRKGDVYYLYHGEHIFSAYYKTDFDYSGSSYLCIYNADTGAAAEYADLKLSYAGYTDAYVPYSFSEGKAVAVSEDTVYRIDTELNVTPILTDRPDGEVYYQNGILFTGEEHYSGRDPSPCVENGRFYNVDGSTLVDLSQYTLILDQAYELYRYENGRAAILVYGEDGGWYLGIIDRNGEFAFEPVKIETYSSQDNIGTFSCDVISTQISRNIDGKTVSKYILLTAAGEMTEIGVAYNTVGSLVFADGFAWYNEGKQYIGTDGTFLRTVLDH